MDERPDETIRRHAWTWKMRSVDEKSSPVVREEKYPNPPVRGSHVWWTWCEKKKEEEAVRKWVYFKGQEETRWAKLLANDVVSSAGVEEGRECVNQQQQHRRWGIMAVRWKEERTTRGKVTTFVHETAWYDVTRGNRFGWCTSIASIPEKKSTMRASRVAAALLILCYAIGESSFLVLMRRDYAFLHHFRNVINPFYFSPRSFEFSFFFFFLVQSSNRLDLSTKE